MEATKRQGIPHFDTFLDTIPEGTNFYVGDVSVKIDGFGLRLGRNGKGHFFMESSRSGPIYDPQDFIDYTYEKTTNVIRRERATHYHDLFCFFLDNKFDKVFPKNSKAVFECLYVPMGKVTIDYKTPHRHWIDLFPIQFYGSIASSSFLFRDILSNFNDIDLRVTDTRISSDCLFRKLSTTEETTRVIMDFYKSSAEDIMGPEMEGLVLTCKDKQYKITTDYYKELRKK